MAIRAVNSERACYSCRAMNPLAASAHPDMVRMFYAAGVLYALAALVTLARPHWGRWPLALGAGAHLGAMIARGLVIGYLPLTGKMESFSSAALAMALVAVVVWRPHRLYAIGLVTLTLALYGAAASYHLDLRYPVPPLITIWYPLHVPLSFVCYGLWAAAALAGATWFATRDPAWDRLVNRLALWGFGGWSLSMIFGGIWGVVAWGAYFLWDPKVIWSVILWFHYATLLHVRLTPSLRRRPWVQPTFALVGLLWIFVAYIGTSFLFGGSSHSF